MGERSFWRDLTYHLFHRTESAKRFMADEMMAYTLKMCDIDCLEYCHYCREPVALIDVKGCAYRKGVYTEPMVRLARRANIPAFVVFYDDARELNPVYVGKTNIDGEAIRDI